MTRAARILLGVMLVLGAATPAWAQGTGTGTPEPAAAPPAPNPGRPTVSSPATLTPVGYLQFEQGFIVLRNSSEFSSQFSLNQVTKLTVHRRLELLLGSQPYARSIVGGQPQNDFAGISGGAQFVMYQGSGVKPTVAVNYIHPFNGGTAPSPDVGSVDQLGTLLFSLDASAVHIDVNFIVSTQHNDTMHRTQNGQTLSVAFPVASATLAVELWRFSQPLQGDASCGGLLIALSHPLGETIVIDGGLNKGLTSTSTHWAFFGGFTYLLPKKLW